MAMRVILGGGGTGGHLMPGIALAREILAEDDSSSVLFLCSDRESDVLTLKRYGFAANPLPSKPPSRNPLAWPSLAWGSLTTFCSVYRIISAFKPDVAVGLGGFASFFPVVASRLQGVPIVLLEQNVVPGKATRRLAGIAREVVCQWAETVRYFGVKTKASVLGNPVRDEILAGTRDTALERLHLDAAKKTLLVTGGSQGAHAVNTMMIESAPELAARAGELQVVHLSGHSDREAVADAYKQAGIQAETIAYLDDMSSAYRVADFAVSRAGGTTIAEFAACGIPAILVPYPYAADQHQLRNAQSLAEAGAAVVLQQEDFSPGRLAGMIGTFLDNQVLTRRMRTAALAQARPGAARSVLGVIRGYAGALESIDSAQALTPQTIAKRHT